MKSVKDSWVEVEKIRQLGKNNFAAKAVIIHHDERRETLHEFWGETVIDAEAKAQAELNAFLGI